MTEEELKTWTQTADNLGSTPGPRRILAKIVHELVAEVRRLQAELAKAPDYKKTVDQARADEWERCAKVLELAAEELRHLKDSPQL